MFGESLGRPWRCAYSRIELAHSTTVRPEQSVPKPPRDASSKGDGARRPSTPRPDKASDALLRVNGFRNFSSLQIQ